MKNRTRGHGNGAGPVPVLALRLRVDVPIAAARAALAAALLELLTIHTILMNYRHEMRGKTNFAEWNAVDIVLVGDGGYCARHCQRYLAEFLVKIDVLSVRVHVPIFLQNNY